MADCVAVLNAGSSSIKFALFEGGLSERLLFRGQIENIGVAPRLSVEDDLGKQVAEDSWDPKKLDHESGTKVILQTAIALLGGKSVGGVGHRVVHGGVEFTQATRVSTGRPRGAQQAFPPCPTASTAQSGADPGYCLGRTTYSAGRLLRHRVSSIAARARTDIRCSARAHGVLVSGGTVFTGCHMNSLPAVYATWHRPMPING